MSLLYKIFFVSISFQVSFLTNHHPRQVGLVIGGDLRNDLQELFRNVSAVVPLHRVLWV